MSSRSGASTVIAQSPAQLDGHHNKGSMSLRKAVEKEEDQEKVWSKVDEINKDNKTISATKSYTAITNSAGCTKKLDAYLGFFSNKFAANEDVAGVVIVTGNKVLGCDMFATPRVIQEPV